MNCKQYICMRLSAICLSNKVEKFSHPLLPPALDFSLGKEMASVWGSNLGIILLKVEATPSHKRPHFGQVTNFCTDAVGGLLQLRGKRRTLCSDWWEGKECARAQDHGREQNQGAVGWKHLEVVRRFQTLWRPWARESGTCADIWATFLYMNRDVRKNGNGWCSRMKRSHLFF